MQRVAITGIGIVSVLGLTPEEVATALYQGRSGIVVDAERLERGFESGLTGRISGFSAKKLLKRKQRKTMTEHAVHAYAAAMDGLSMAGLSPEDWQNDRTGIIFGCDSSCLAALEQVRLLAERGETGLIGSGAIFRSMTSNVTMNLNTMLGTRGAAWTLSSACSSGGHAVGQGFTLIAMGQQDRVICGGAQEINWESMCSFDGLGAFADNPGDPGKACRPFDANRSGLVPSGGAAAVILERYDLAEARGATILGEVCGYGFSSDGEHLSVPSTTGLAAAGTMALQHAKATPGDIEYVCAHATATPAGDAAEAANLKHLFQDASPVISSTKSMTGHELWMSGASQVVYTTLMARNGFMAPNINLETLQPEAEGLHVTPETVERPPPDRALQCRRIRRHQFLPGPEVLMRAFDHVVVGGGIAGMTVALLLGKSGASVALVEAFPLLSPTVRGFKRKGVQFETGLHYLGGLGQGHPLDTYFKHLDIRQLIQPIPYDPDGFDRFVFEQTRTEFALPSGYDALMDAFTRWFPEERRAITTYFTTIRDAFASSPYLNFDLEFDLGNVLHGDTTTLLSFLDGLTDNEQLRTLFSFPNLLYGVPPEEALLATHAQVAGSYYLSAHTLEGGGLALVNAYEQRLAEAGVEVFCGSPVTMVDIDASRQVKGVVLGTGDRLPTRSCIWTAHPGGLVAATPDSAFRSAFKKRLAALEDTTSGVMLFGVSDAPIPGLDRCSRYLWPGGSFSAMLNGETALKDSIIYLSASRDPQSGKYAITAIAPQKFSHFAQWKDSTRTTRPPEYTRAKDILIREFTAQVLDRAPELRDRVTFIDGATPLTFRDYCGTPTGSLYGLRQSNNQFNPAPVTKAEGLTLAGEFKEGYHKGRTSESDDI